MLLRKLCALHDEDEMKTVYESCDMKKQEEHKIRRSEIEVRCCSVIFNKHCLATKDKRGWEAETDRSNNCQVMEQV